MAVKRPVDIETWWFVFLCSLEPLLLKFKFIEKTYLGSTEKGLKKKHRKI